MRWFHDTTTTVTALKSRVGAWELGSGPNDSTAGTIKAVVSAGIRWHKNRQEDLGNRLPRYGGRQTGIQQRQRQHPHRDSTRTSTGTGTRTSASSTRQAQAPVPVPAPRHCRNRCDATPYDEPAPATRATYCVRTSTTPNSQSQLASVRPLQARRPLYARLRIPFGSRAAWFLDDRRRTPTQWAPWACAGLTTTAASLPSSRLHAIRTPPLVDGTGKASWPQPRPPISALTGCPGVGVSQRRSLQL